MILMLYSVLPLFVAQGCAVEFLAVKVPQGHETMHIGNETLVVMAFEQVDHFMDDDVLKAMKVILDRELALFGHSKIACEEQV